MNPFEAASATHAYRERCEDHVAVFSLADRTVVAVADGAGGTGAGEEAARTATCEVQRACANVQTPADWASMLRQIDCRLSQGETTLVVVDLRPSGISGASVGDSRAVVVCESTITELTENQIRKPLLGSGAAEPVAFASAPLAGLLLVGTDGFFSYAKPHEIQRLAATSEFSELPNRCIRLVQLPSGDYWDDVGIVAVRPSRRSKTRQRFVID